MADWAALAQDRGVLLLALILVLCAFGLWLRGRLARRSRRKVIVVDGSNVMHWAGGEASVQTLDSVLRALQGARYAPEVWLDANVGHKLFGRYAGPAALAAALPVPSAQIHVADKGTPADPGLIRSALRQGVPILTNDRFLDWRDDFPQLANEGRLIAGRWNGGKPEFRFR